MIVTVPGVQEEVRRNGVETEKNRDKSSNCDVCVTCVDVSFIINCFGIELVLCDLHVTRFDLAKGLLFDTFFIVVFYKLCRCDH